ncbi:MAG TPA: hypothetical protein PK771_00225 [Spirochaetota bacterium]|nr:hypothetical protein [Spirochaetota bacterium]
MFTIPIITLWILKITEISNKTVNLNYNILFLLSLFFDFSIYFFILWFNNNNLTITSKSFIFENKKNIFLIDYLKLPCEIIENIYIEKKVVLSGSIGIEYYCLVLKTFEPLKNKGLDQIINKINFLQEKEVTKFFDVIKKDNKFNLSISELIEFSEIHNKNILDLNKYALNIKKLIKVDIYSITITILFVIYLITKFLIYYII